LVFIDEFIFFSINLSLSLENEIGFFNPIRIRVFLALLGGGEHQIGLKTLFSFKNGQGKSPDLNHN